MSTDGPTIKLPSVTARDAAPGAGAVERERALKVAVDAWDAERCRLNERWHGGRCEPASEAAKANKAPMILAAVEAYNAALRPAARAADGLADIGRLLTRIDDASLGMIELKGAEWDRANADHIAAVARIRQAFAAQDAIITDLRARLAAPAGAAPGAVAPFQARVAPWVVACFGDDVACDELERMDRFVEEVFEAVQSRGYDPARIDALKAYVYGREPGETRQEIGGVMMTLAAWCNAIGQDMHEAGEAELTRVWDKVETIRAKQAAKPKGSALPVAVPSKVKLQEGKCYRSYEGKKVGPVYPSSRDKGIWYSRTKAGGGDWHDDGQALHGFPPDRPPLYDLVAEWVEEPSPAAARGPEGVRVPAELVVASADGTPGPWVAESGGGRGAWIKGSTGEWAALSCGDTDTRADSNGVLIAAAVNRLREEIAATPDTARPSRAEGDGGRE